MHVRLVLEMAVPLGIEILSGKRYDVANSITPGPRIGAETASVHGDVVPDHMDNRMVLGAVELHCQAVADADAPHGLVLKGDWTSSATIA